MYNDVDLVMYADDTVLYTHGKNATEVAMKLIKEMQKVVEWLNNSCKLRDCPEILVNGQKKNPWSNS